MWDGGTAHQIGLVDGFGGMSDAIAKAAQLAGLGNERGVRYLEPQRSFRDQLIEALAGSNDDDTAAPPDAFSTLARAAAAAARVGARRGAFDPRRARASRRAASSARSRAGAASSRRT